MRSRAVVWRTGALGDFVCTLPVVEALAAQHDLTLIAPARYQVLVDAPATWIDADGLDAAAIIAGRRRLEADLGVAWTRGACEALARAGVGRVLCGTPRPTLAICDHLWAPVAPLLGARTTDPRVTPRPGLVDALRARHGCPVVIAPGSGGARKRWPLGRWHDVAEAAAREVLWVGGPLEEGEEGWGTPARFDLDLEGLAALAASCTAWLGPDAGPSHLAAAVGARVGVVFVGATDPRIWAPPGATVLGPEATPADVVALIHREHEH